MPAAILWHSELTGRHSRLAKKLGPIDIPTAPSEHSRNMGTFLKNLFWYSSNGTGCAHCILFTFCLTMAWRRWLLGAAARRYSYDSWGYYPMD